MGERRLVVRAIHEYIPAYNDELHLEPGSNSALIAVTNVDEDSGWWEGTTLDSRARTGWLPSNYVSIVEEVEVTEEEIAESNQYERRIMEKLIRSEEAFLSEMGAFLDLDLPCPQQSSSEEESVSQMRKLCNDIVTVHKSEVHNQLKSTKAPGSPLQIGSLFKRMAAHLQPLYLNYASFHPEFVMFVQRHREELEVLPLFKAASAPFRRLDVYGRILGQMGRRLPPWHPEKGDLQRGSKYYLELGERLREVRRSKELELEEMEGEEEAPYVGLVIYFQRLHDSGLLKCGEDDALEGTDYDNAPVRLRVKRLGEDLQGSAALLKRFGKISRIDQVIPSSDKHLKILNCDGDKMEGFTFTTWRSYEKADNTQLKTLNDFTRFHSLPPDNLLPSLINRAHNSNNNRPVLIRQDAFDHSSSSSESLDSGLGDNNNDAANSEYFVETIDITISDCGSDNDNENDKTKQITTYRNWFYAHWWLNLENVSA